MKSESTCNKVQNTDMSRSLQHHRPKALRLDNLVLFMIFIFEYLYKFNTLPIKRTVLINCHKSMRTNLICLQYSFKALDGTKSYTWFLINHNLLIDGTCIWRAAAALCHVNSQSVSKCNDVH